MGFEKCDVRKRENHLLTLLIHVKMGLLVVAVGEEKKQWDYEFMGFKGFNEHGLVLYDGLTDWEYNGSERLCDYSGQQFRDLSFDGLYSEFGAILPQGDRFMLSLGIQDEFMDAGKRDPAQIGWLAEGGDSDYTAQAAVRLNFFFPKGLFGSPLFHYVPEDRAFHLSLGGEIDAGGLGDERVEIERYYALGTLFLNPNHGNLTSRKSSGNWIDRFLALPQEIRFGAVWERDGIADSERIDYILKYEPKFDIDFKQAVRIGRRGRLFKSDSFDEFVKPADQSFSEAKEEGFDKNIPVSRWSHITYEIDPDFHVGRADLVKDAVGGEDLNESYVGASLGVDVGIPLFDKLLRVGYGIRADTPVGNFGKVYLMQEAKASMRFTDHDQPLVSLSAVYRKGTLTPSLREIDRFSVGLAMRF